MTHLILAAALLAAGGQQTPATQMTPARLVHGTVPVMPIAMLSGGQVVLELTIDLDGRVAGVRTLRSTPPLTARVADAVRSWRFDPSHQRVETAGDTIRFSFMTARVSKVLVAAVFRAPALSGPTLGSAPASGEPADPETPVLLDVKTPSFPPAAFGAGMVLVEVDIADDGSVSDACVIESAPPFDEAAVSAARQLRFRPGRIAGMPVRSYAYVLFGFPMPVTDAARR